MVDLITGNQTTKSEETQSSKTKKWRAHLIEMAQMFILDTTVLYNINYIFKLKAEKEHKDNVCVFIVYFSLVAGSKVYWAAQS